MRMQPRKTNGTETDDARVMEPLDAERRELAVRYMPLAYSTARKFAYGWGWLLDEMESAALVALVEAARTFEPARNVRFSTFLRKRLLGALLDTRRQMSQSCARIDPADFVEEEPDYIRTKSHSNLSPDEVLDYEERIVGGSEGAEDPPLFEVHEALRAEFLRLPPRHREVMDGIYVQHLSYDELAESMGCTKPRLVAVHRESIDMLLKQRQKVEKRPRRPRKRRTAGTAFPASTEPPRDTM